MLELKLNRLFKQNRLVPNYKSRQSAKHVQNVSPVNSLRTSIARNKQSPHYSCYLALHVTLFHDDVIKWKHFPRYWPFVRGIHRSSVNSSHKGQWRGDLTISLICAWINGWVNNREAGDLRWHRTHYHVTVMPWRCEPTLSVCSQYLTAVKCAAALEILDAENRS